MAKRTKGMALVTGASAGIGAALAPLFAAEGFDLALVARREAPMKALAAKLRREHGTRSIVLPADLAAPAAARSLARVLARERVAVLVNNAGFYEVGEFTAMAPERVRQMVELNVAALAELTHAFLPPMVERGAGRILNVASIAAFQAVPFLSLYAATKAFVLSLTEGLAEELKGSGVTVTAVCPGITETEGVRSARKKSPLAARVPDVFVYDEARVARDAFRACMAGDVVCVPGAMNQLMASVNRYPRSLVRMVNGLVMRQLGER
ncbi:MAG: SDR family NAD(P)-dependent oxidoreductase [Burkholderiales bacterium]|nr:SDR family NAD(P)-dependent oxidoreductase [Burkholderiales bacterium]